MRIVCVAEKPSIAKALTQALDGGRHSTRDSMEKFVKNYDFDYNFNAWGPCSVTVTSVLGHITEMEFAPPFDKWSQNMEDAKVLFTAPIEVRDNSKGVKIGKNIQKECARAGAVYIWTDCDLEGEYIGQEIVDHARKGNRNIEVYRAIFNNTDPQHMRDAAQRPQRLDGNKVAAVRARQELDLRSGFSMTRFQTIAFQRNFQDFQKKVVSYGSCQFPTLGFVVDRYFKVKNFIPEPFWKIDLATKTDNKKLAWSWDRGHLFDMLSATILYERMLERAGNQPAKVIAKTCKPTSQYKPLPLTTVKLQKLGVQYLKMTSQQIMRKAEDLYNKGWISYPRTETDQFDNSMDLRALVGKHRNNTVWGDYAKKLLDGKFSQPRKGTHNDKAHPPIHPVKSATQDAVGADWPVYELVCRHFLACCSDDAKGERTSATLEYGDEKFNASGVVVKELNYLEIYKYASWKTTPIPDVEQDAELQVVSAMLKQGKTSAPHFITEPELIGLMDANRIGTDATMADHIAKIKERNFIDTQNKYFVPTTLGVALVEAYNSMGLDQSLTKPFLRRETERQVNAIAEGRARETVVTKDLVDRYKKVFETSVEKHNVLMETARRIFGSS